MYEDYSNELRIFPDKRQIPDHRPKTFILFPFELHEKMREPFEDKEAEALELIKNHLKVFKKFFIASSHGKDSLVLVHMVWRACNELGIPMVDVFLNHTLNVYKEEKAFWEVFNKWLGIEDNFKIFYPLKDEKGRMYTVWSIAEKYKHLPNFRRTARDGIPSRQTNTPECCDILKKKSINLHLKELDPEERYDCHFVGTRAEESQIRSLGVLQRCRSYQIKTRKAYPIQTVTPLSFLTTHKWKNHQGEWKEQSKYLKNGKLRKNTKKIFVPHDDQTKPENDIEMYFKKWNMPVDPTYEIHNIERMGCASCPAHLGWEKRLARDPTEEGFGMLKQNFKIMANTETGRLEKSIETLKKYLNSQESDDELSDKMRERIILMIQGHDCNV